MTDQQLQFDEGAPLSYATPTQRLSKMTRLLMKASGGLIKTERQAAIVWLIIAVLLLGYAFLSLTHTRKPTPPQPVQYDLHGNIIVPQTTN